MANVPRVHAHLVSYSSRRVLGVRILFLDAQCTAADDVSHCDVTGVSGRSRACASRFSAPNQHHSSFQIDSRQAVRDENRPLGHDGRRPPPGRAGRVQAAAAAAAPSPSKNRYRTDSLSIRHRLPTTRQWTRPDETRR